MFLTFLFVFALFIKYLCIAVILVCYIDLIWILMNIFLLFYTPLALEKMYVLGNASFHIIPLIE